MGLDMVSSGNSLLHKLSRSNALKKRSLNDYHCAGPRSRNQILESLHCSQHYCLSAVNPFTVDDCILK